MIIRRLSAGATVTPRTWARWGVLAPSHKPAFYRSSPCKPGLSNHSGGVIPPLPLRVGSTQIMGWNYVEHHEGWRKTVDELELPTLHKSKTSEKHTTGLEKRSTFGTFLVKTTNSLGSSHQPHSGYNSVIDDREG